MTGMRKVSYLMRKVALSAAAIQTRLSGYPVRAYKCQFCKCYHLTHQPQSNYWEGAA